MVERNAHPMRRQSTVVTFKKVQKRLEMRERMEHIKERFSQKSLTSGYSSGKVKQAENPTFEVYTLIN